MSDLDLLHISIADQMLYGFTAGRLRLRLPVSTALNGVGERNGSGCTPRGRHQVRARIGDGLPAGAVLRGRRWTGEIWNPELHAQFPGRDWILSRILWLSGCEPGYNRMGQVDTFRRYIYLHGARPIRNPWACRFPMAASGCAMPTCSSFFPWSQQVARYG